MIKIISEATIIGLITLILGKIIIELSIRESKNKKLNHPKGINFAFFFTGFLLHFLIEYLGLNCWYCNKKCFSGIRQFI